MTTNFDSIQTLKSSDVCGKVSKSVSYETLVGGTTTTGTEIKQKESSLILRKAKFQAIFEFVLSSASGGAGGGKYSRISAFVSMLVLLIRRSREKFFKKNFRDDSSFFVASPKDSLHRHSEPKAKNPKNNIKDWILRFAFAPLRMTIHTLTLAVVLSTGIVSESWAESWNCGAKDANGEYSDSVKCIYDEESKTMTVSGKGNMGNYYSLSENNKFSSSAPWSGKPIENVVIGDGVTSVGASAFAFNDSLKSVSGMKDVERLEASAFNTDSKITSFVMPEKLKYIGDNALQYVNSLNGQVFELPDTLEFVGIDALKFNGVFIITDNLNSEGWHNEVFKGHNPTFVCKGNINVCQSKIAKFIKKTEGGIGTCETERCLDNDAYTLVEANSEQCTGNYGWNGASCVKKDEDGNVTCASGFVEWDNQCWDEYPFAKKRWTPAEANEWLRDGNDNFVVITFKK